MSGSQHTHATESWAGQRRRADTDHEDRTLVKSYRYLRTAMVGLLVFLAVAVVIQSVQQGSILSSISAYYYTPGHAVFVGVLLGTGVCMIALKGTTEAEDILLNIGGILAPVVAFVPTARSDDYRTALQACRAQESAVNQGLPATDCPTILALQEATEANISNNVSALLIVGALGLIAAALFRLLDNRKRTEADDVKTSRSIRLAWIGIAAATVVYLGGLLMFTTMRQTFINTAHYIAALGLFACIVLVALVNARRRRGENLESKDPPAGPNREFFVALYTLVASAMIIAVAVGFPLVLAGTFEDTVLWLEAILIVLFASFWGLQTAERWSHDHLDEANP